MHDYRLLALDRALQTTTHQEQALETAEAFYQFLTKD